MMHINLRRISLSGLLLLALAGLVFFNPLAKFHLAGAAQIQTALGIVAAAPTTPCTSTGTAVNCDFYAMTGTLTIASQTLPVWGYAATPGGPVSVPGPTIIAKQGDTVNVTLHNSLNQNSSLSFPSMPGAPDLIGASSGMTKTYTFQANQPGTSLYEAGMTKWGKVQVAMGMYGAMIIRPSLGGSPVMTQAYGAGSDFNVEAALVLSEIDPNLNKSADPTAYDLHTYAPKYWLINGKTYPQTENILTNAAGDKVLLRYLNAGLTDHSVGTMGLHSWIYGTDGRALPKAYQVTAETLASGESLDMITQLPATATPGAKYALYNAANHLDNGDVAAANTLVKYGGMLTFLVAPGTASTPTGPTITSVSANPNYITSNVAVTVTAAVSGTFNGNTNLPGEYFIDTPPASSAVRGTPMTKSGSNLTATISSTLVSSLANGNHVIYVRAHQGTGATQVWGPLGSGFLYINRPVPVGPVVTLNKLAPNPANGSSDLTLDVTASTAGGNGLKVTDAEYFFDPTSTPLTTTRGTAMTFDTNGPGSASTTSLNASIVSNTIGADGVHNVVVRAKDAGGNWGGVYTATLTVDKTAPSTTAVAGTSQPDKTIKLTATISDTTVNNVQSNIVGAEFFIDKPNGANGTGAGMFSSGANFNTTWSNVGVYYVLTTNDLTGLAAGQHTLYVHGQDAAGNWGKVISNTFTVDKVGPTISALTAAKSGTNGITFTITASDATTGGSNIIAVEYFEGADPGAGNATALKLPNGYTPSPTINALNITRTGFATGNHTIWVRVKDGAGNWGTAKSVTVRV